MFVYVYVYVKGLNPWVLFSNDNCSVLSLFYLKNSKKKERMKDKETLNCRILG